jgi:hypothetical protein
MKDTLSLLLAATIIAAGGVGLYMFKSRDDDEQGGGGEEYNEDSIFNSGSFWGSNKSEDEVEEDVEEGYYEPKARARGGKTKRNRRGSGTKRRH